MTFNSDQLGMAIFLLIAVFFNIWFIYTSYERALVDKKIVNGFDSYKYKLVTYSVLAMALFDILWVWLCMVQCWNNTFNNNDFNQSSGNNSFGCKFMGWYSSFSLVSMMGSHCLVVNYLKNLYQPETKNCTESNTSFFGLCFTILVASCIFASMPLLQGDGYKLTTGGFCYADFTNKIQSSVILGVVLFFLTLATLLWLKINRWSQYWYFFVVLFATWILWVPATSYGIAEGQEIPSPYMIIGAIVGHGNAIVNPILYGAQLFRILNNTGNKSMIESRELLDVDEQPRIEISSTPSQQV